MIRFISAALAAITALSGVGTHAFTPDDAVREVRRALARLPYYGVFDFIAFGVDRGTVTLVGYAYEDTLKRGAEMAVRRVAGVDAVANNIELLPASVFDDRIRWATFFRIYTDDFLSRYAPGGPSQVFQELRDDRHFPGMEPVGIYPIHIVVKNGRTMLLGVVGSASDRQIAEVRAREVTGVFDVENSLIVGRYRRDLANSTWCVSAVK